ncbi:hypothetical protein [Pseudoalteromonas sp. MMG005]|uniref:hypothetical protein n=1 Tax=Pseudoalteromonas sp. MMG005 TaxID=2822682 RepID=UPI001FFD25F5|nr:hypothetical protein [Pseudoalteromonas sp. MMG005]
MKDRQLERIRNSLLIIVVIFQICHLSWEYFNGGIVTHHILMRSDLPGISNWWGLIILPSLVFITFIRIKRRLLTRAHEALSLSDFYRNILIGFMGMLLVSLLASLAFSFGLQNIAVYMLMGLMITALFIPLHKAECILGYVMGAAFFTGPVIPFIGVVLFSTVSVLSHYCFKPLLLRFKSVKKDAV